MTLDDEARETIRILRARDVAKVLIDDDGRAYGLRGVTRGTNTDERVPVDLSLARVLRRCRLLGIDLRSV